MPGEGRRAATPTATSSRGALLLVETEEAVARIVIRQLRARRVIWVNAIAKAARTLERTPNIDTVITAYRLRDGTARKLFSRIQGRWPHVRKVLYIEASLVDGSTEKLAVSLADVVITDFADLRRALG